MGKESKKVFKYKTDLDKLHKVYLTVINGILHLTKKEIEVAAKFYKYLDEIEQGVTDKRIQHELLFSTNYKKRIREELGMSGLLLNNYVSSLRNKKIIQEVDGVKFLNENLRIKPNDKGMTVSFEFQL